MIFKNSYTKENLKKAIQGEALAYIKYQIYAQLIGNESKELEEKMNHIAHNEKEHFKVFLKLLRNDDYYDNVKNIEDAINGETEECNEKYPEFARVARAEGFHDIADKFEEISKIECSHSAMFQDFLDEILNTDEEKNNNGFICLNCGYIHKGNSIVEKCPVCDHPKKYFVYVD